MKLFYKSKQDLIKIESFILISNVNFNGNNLKDPVSVASVSECENICALDDLCFTFTFLNGSCWLKFRYKYIFTSTVNTNAVSGYPMIGF